MKVKLLFIDTRRFGRPTAALLLAPAEGWGPFGPCWGPSAPSPSSSLRLLQSHKNIKMVASNRYGSNQLKFQISTLQLFKRLRYGHLKKIQDGRQTKPNLKILKRQFEAECPYASIDTLKSKIRPLLAVLYMFLKLTKIHKTSKMAANPNQI